MNPNSAHQIWSQWHYTVAAVREPSLTLVRDNCARFGRRAFGSAAQMRVQPAWTIAILAEGVPVWDAAFVTWMHARWRRFLSNGFGADAVITSTARLMAGPVESRPPDQMIIVPAITLTGKVG